MKGRKFFWFLLILMIIVAFPCIGLLLFFMASHGDFSSAPNRIGVIEVEGLIKDAKPFLDSLATFRKDPKVRAIVIRIDTPGGGVGASQEMYREVQRTREVKPVVASLGGVAASGGYYVASAADYIVASPGTLTGSIGVVVHLPNLKGLFEKIGYATVTIKSGRFKDVGNPSREITPEERELLQETVRDMHEQFVRDVAAGRGLPEEHVRRIADGRVLSGEKALEWKLIDALGNFQDALDKAKELGKIAGEPRIVYAKKKRRSLIDFILGESGLNRLELPWDPAMSPVRYQMILGQ